MRRLLAKRLRAARLSCGFQDVRAFADALDMPAERYERFEEGLEEPGYDDLAHIAKITGKTLDFLITGAGRAASWLAWTVPVLATV